MFGFTKKDKRTNLEKQIDSVLAKMSEYEADSEEYKKMSENLERLYKAKVNEPQRGWKVSPDVIAMGLFGIAQMLLILNFEKADVITSKAFGYIWRGRA